MSQYKNSIMLINNFRKVQTSTEILRKILGFLTFSPTGLLYLCVEKLQLSRYSLQRKYPFQCLLNAQPKKWFSKTKCCRCVEIFSKPVKAKIESQRVFLKMFKTQHRVFKKIALFSKRCGVNMCEKPGCGLYLGV